MALTKVGNEYGYLDLTKMNFKEESVSIAFMFDIRISATRDVGKPYLSMFIKEVGGNLIRGWMFNKEVFDDMGFTVAMMKRRPVKIWYQAQVRHGSISLVVHRVELYNDSFEYEKFLGGIESANDDLKRSNESLKHFGVDPNLVFPSEYATASYVDVCAGRAGGYAKLVWSCIKSLNNYFATPSVDPVQISTIYAKSMNFYAKYLDTLAKSEVVLKHQIMTMVYQAAEIDDVRLRNIITDVCLSLSGMSEPEHMYSHLIVDTVRKEMSHLDLCFSYALMVEGSTKREGEKLIAKY